ncbi:hypothetical protein LMG22037_06372 [Paraburkholderia phenoliruptrix]|uniref:Uncharacterized protein n=1 Tax=Paraburkholderia phenoliruptrix TaxID=252970 RepID=A0A6J5CN96_9BURK|nr:hypothetical protein LMG22037_06372 [Paraburkholderia phenoliruptrix]
MVMLIARPVRDGETDLLPGNEREPLFLRSLAGQVTLRIDPTTPWTHESLVAAVESEAAKAFASEHFGADAYLGGLWVGSSEV